MRLVLLGALSTVIATVIIWILTKTFARVFRNEAQVVWRQNRETFNVVMSKRQSISVRLHELVLENIGREKAKEIVVKMSSIPEDIKFDLKRRVWFSDEPLNTYWRETDKHSELGIERNGSSIPNSIVFRNLLPGRLLVLSFVQPLDFEVDSVFVDGEFLPAGGIEPATYKKVQRPPIFPWYVKFFFVLSLIALAIWISRL